METTVLRSAYDRLLDAAAIPDLGDADDGGWNADQILAHLLSVDASIAAVALSIVAYRGPPSTTGSPSTPGILTGSSPSTQIGRT